jgi:hypothetical protein
MHVYCMYCQREHSKGTTYLHSDFVEGNLQLLPLQWCAGRQVQS